MSAEIRFHLDESADARILSGLRQRVIDVTSPSDAQLLSARDDEHLEFALRECRVLITHDSDFLQLHQMQVPHAGIAYCPPGARSVGYVVRLLCLMRDCLSADEMRGRVEYL